MNHFTRFSLLLAVAVFPAARAWAFGENVADLIQRFDGIRNDKTPIGVTDGNPLAATSFLASSTFDHYGLRPRISNAPKAEENDFVFDFQSKGGSFESGRIDGFYITADAELGFRFNDNVALSIVLPFEYRNVEGTDTYIAGIELGLPITILPHRDDGLSWTVTPAATAAGLGVSVSLAQGGYLFGGGVTSSLAWHHGALTLLMANQLTYDFGRPIGYSKSYDLRQDIEQTIVKNGLALMVGVGPSATLDASAAYTDLLNRAFVKDYWTFAAGVTFWLAPASGVRLGFDSDYADDFKTFGGSVQLFLSF